VQKMNVDFERNESSWVGEVGMFVLAGGPVGYGILKLAGVNSTDLANGLTDSWSSSGQNLDDAHKDFEKKFAELQNDPRFADRLKYPPGSAERAAIDKAMLAELEKSSART